MFNLVELLIQNFLVILNLKKKIHFETFKFNTYTAILSH